MVIHIGVLRKVVRYYSHVKAAKYEAPISHGSEVLAKVI